MSESLNFSDKRTRIFLVVAVLSGLAFMFIADESFLLTLLTIFGGEDYPRQGILLFDLGDNSCEYYSLDQYLPAGKDQIIHKNARECTFGWKAALKLEKLESVNKSTNNPAINELLLNASKEFDNHNYKKVNRIVDRLKVEREYSVEK